MKTSARNVLAGTVTKIDKGAVNSEVDLTTASGTAIVAIITNNSVEALGLKVGSKASALIKASWVILGTGIDGVKLSARNVLTGTVDSVAEGAVNAEVSVRLAGGEKLQAIITENSLKGLHLKAGDKVFAVIKASSVILAVE